MTPPREPQYVQLKVRRPASVWPVARLLSVASMVALIVALLYAPATGLTVLWGVVVPLLPIVFLLGQTVWRNLCPMAAINQIPRVLGVSRAGRLPGWLERHGFGVALLLFLAVASSRKLGLEAEGQAMAVVLGTAMVLPLLGGLAFRGKSGWCHSLCPLRPIQNLYGQSPAVVVEKSHCRPCVGCTPRCVDLSPQSAFAGELLDETEHAVRYRRLFAGLLPGFILAFYTVPTGAGAGATLLHLLLFVLGSLGAFFALDSLTRIGVERLSTVYAAAAFGVFYWFALPEMAATVSRLGGLEVPAWALWEARALAIALAAGWLVRALRRRRAAGAPTAPIEASESIVARAPGARQPLPVAAAPNTMAGASAASADGAAPGDGASSAGDPSPEETAAAEQDALSGAVAAAAPRPIAGDPPVPVPDRRSRARPHRTPTVTLMPEGIDMEVALGATLLEVATAHDVALEPGCRMGMCGCDPVFVMNGMENLSPASQEESATLERLDLPEHARMACVARVLGDVSFSLEPSLPEAAGAEEPPTTASASAVNRVVIIGNGIAGVTAADHLRRHHSECTIDVVADERHAFYNRTSVSRLIHARTAMRRMYLLPERWYDERRISSWLNTRAVRIDTAGKQVVLGTGEVLPYDRLILASGSSPRIPPIEGFGRPGTFALRQADDAMRVRAYAQASECRRAIVAGGGVLGLEAAEALRQLGLEVAVVEPADRLAGAQLDGRAGQFLKDQVEMRGIEVLLGRVVTAVRGEHAVARAVLDDGTEREAELLLVCAGVTPNAELARDAEIRVGRGVVVDDRMRTSDPTIYAAGDVAEHDGRVYGLWPSALEQAEVAAINALGGAREYRGSIVATHLKLAGVDLTSIGCPQDPPEGALEIALEEAEVGRYRKLVIADGRIVGAILLGYPSDAASVLASIKEARDVRGHLEALRSGDWSVLSDLDFEEAVAASIAGYRPDSYTSTGEEPRPEPAEASTEPASPRRNGGSTNGARRHVTAPRPRERDLA